MNAWENGRLLLYRGETGVWERTYVSAAFLLRSHWCRHRCHACSGLPAGRCKWWRAADPSGGRWWWVQSSHVSAGAKPWRLITRTTASLLGCLCSQSNKWASWGSEMEKEHYLHQSVQTLNRKMQLLNVTSGHWNYNYDCVVVKWDQKARLLWVFLENMPPRAHLLLFILSLVKQFVSGDLTVLSALRRSDPRQQDTRLRFGFSFEVCWLRWNYKSNSFEFQL